MQVALEHALHVLGVRPDTAQVGRRLEGTAAGAVGKILGIQHDAGEQGLGLAFQHVRRLHQILHQLRHQLAGRGGVGLMVVQGHLLNVAAAAAVVVDDGHTVARLQHFLGLHALGAVGVYHHQQGAGLALDKGILAGNGGIGVFRLLGETPQDGVSGVVLGVDDDLAGLAALAGDTADAHGGAQGVHIRVFVTHDVHLLGIVDQLTQSVGHDAGLDLGTFFGGLAAAAVELEVHTVLDHGLIAAAGEGHLQRQGGVLEQLLEAVLVPAHADGQRGGHTLAGLDLADLFQYVELAFGVAGVVLLLEEVEVTVAVVAQQQPAGAGGPVIQLFLQRGQQRRALILGAGLHQLLIVIHHEDGHKGLGQLQGLAHLLSLSDVHPVGGGQGGLVAALRLRAAQGAEDAVDTVVPAELLGIFTLAVQQPAVGEVGDHGIYRRFKDLILQAGQVREHIVAPQDLAGGYIEHQHGQRRVEHIAGPGGVHTAGDTVHVLADRGLGHLVAAAAHQNDQKGHQTLRRRQQRLEGHRHRHKGDEAQAVQRHIGTKSAYDLLAQGNAPPSRRGYYSILRVVYYSTKAGRGQYAFREISGEFSRRGGGCQIPSNAVGKLGVYKWEKLWYTL